MRTWPVLSSYTGAQLRRLALPLGGIGTGTISLGGRGDLRDWEVMNVPARGYVPVGEGGPGQIVLRTVDEAGLPLARLAEGPIDPADWLGGQGCGEPNHGLPRFAHCRVDAAYPLMQVHLDDPAVPLAVRLEAFNPLVPGDVAASALPVAVLRYVVTNTGTQSRPVTLCASLPNHVGSDGSRREAGWDGRLGVVGAKRNRNTAIDADGLHGVALDSAGVDPADPAWGSLAMAILGDGARSQRCHWAGGGWGRPLLDFWDDLLADGALDERPDRNEDAPAASLTVTRELAAGATTVFTVLIAWHFPNRRSWTADAPLLTNHYTTVFANAWDALCQTAAQLPQLEERTVAFVRSVVDSDLPRPLAEAALFNLAVLRSQTCFRTADGLLFGWEGMHDNRGSCHGSCTHVWNYEHATAHLFPDLARGMREVEFLHSTADDGCMSFRVSLPLERPQRRKAAADGQLGCLVKLWREWRQGAGDAWLARLWPRARQALAFCWIPGGWDGDGDGVMEGCQHNTMDVEYCGPNPQMQGWYLAALRAAEEMARHLGDTDFAGHCRRLYDHGRAWMDRELGNGHFYEHRVTAIDPATVPSELVIGMGGAGGADLQLAGGCLVDQLVGDACARLYGLGGLHDAAHTTTTLESIASLNRRDPATFNPMRSFALGDEPALVMAHYPEGRRPAVPFPYFAEAMTGFEYTAAISFVQAGMDEVALRTVADVRARHDGRRRNPFSEPECGHHYARAMASWGVLLAWTGQRWDAPSATLHLGGRPGRYPWCAGEAWGWYHLDGAACEIACLSGALPVRALAIAGRTLAAGPLVAGARLVVTRT